MLEDVRWTGTLSSFPDLSGSVHEAGRWILSVHTDSVRRQLYAQLFHEKETFCTL